MNLRRTRLRSARWTLVVAMGAIAYVALLLRPHPLFAYSVSDGNLTLHARTTLPPRAAAILDDARGRVAASPFYRASDQYALFLSDTPRLFAFFTLWNYRAGGVTQWELTSNIFLRPAHVDRDRLVGPSGNEAPGERTLAYFIAHEVTHAMVARRLGRVGYARLERWQVEGYADYVAKAGAFDFDENLTALRAGAPELEPARSGLYRRYHLLVAYELDRKRMSAEALLARPIGQGSIERELLTDGGPGR